MSAIENARNVIADSAIRTPLVRFHIPSAPVEIYLKLENLQPIGSFKIRGASNAIARLPTEKMERGVVTASAGNMAQGVAWCAQKLGIPCTVIAPETAPETKISAIERLGGHVMKVSFDEWWRAFEERAYPGVDGAFIHAFDDPDVMAGNGTIAFEILEDLPDVDAVVIPWGGGGLTCGIGSALRSLRPACKIFTAEVATAAPLAASMAAGVPTEINYQPSWVDGIGAKAVFPQMFARARNLIDGTLVADLPSVAEALRLMVQHNHIVAEGAGACPVACALSGGVGSGRIVCVVSGGNIDSTKLQRILA
ncbi:MAG TPA: pyridoxal-phosphate dependent enzyme [Pyrinomonadaceae bacterium]|nr:pyridoxal-phosphate dependent enzyme [Pyrinomonadaceae bacterium]